MNGTITFTGNLLTDISVARAAGYDAFELPAPKAERMLAAGLSLSTLLQALGDMAICNVGAVLNLERHGDDLSAFLSEVERVSELAAAVGAPMIQLCTGPVDRDVVGDFRAGRLGPDDVRYRGTLGLSAEDGIARAAANLGEAALIAGRYGLDVCVEPLAWTPVSRLSDAIRVLESSGASNVGLCVDFWHVWAAGDEPSDVAGLPAGLVRGVQVADGTAFDRTRDIADQRRDRDVLIGGGLIPLQEWVDAVKAHGYSGWYSAEMFSTRAKQLEPVKLATAMRHLLEILAA